MGRQAKLKLQATPQQHSLIGTASAAVCSICSTWHSILSAPTRIQNAVSALQICVCNALQATLTGFILCRNIPAMPMSCSQVKHKSSGFFISSLQKNLRLGTTCPRATGGCSDA